MSHGSPLPEKAVALSGVGLIAAERNRQIFKEGWSPSHDDHHKNGGMARAAAAYALSSCRANVHRFAYLRKKLWPWGSQWWKPKSPIRDLVRAGALCAAEIDRRLRAGEKVDE